MSITAVAVVTQTPGGAVVRNVVGKLERANGTELLMVITNDQGYDVFNQVPVPFDGTLKLQGTMTDGNAYSVSVSIPVAAVNVTLRVGGMQVNPQDIVLPPVVPFKGGSALPAVPTREQVCGAVTWLQGLDYDTVEFGVIPAWGLEVLSPESRQRAYQAHHAVGNTQVHFELTGSYKEPNTLWPDLIRNGADYSQNLPEFKKRIREVVCNGFFPDIPLGGDGQSVNDNPQFGEYNDPVGSTYGYQWLMLHLEEVLKAMRGDADSACPDGEDLTKYCMFRPGWDAVFYGWTPEQVNQFGILFRTILPNGYLAIEHDMGHIPVGNGPADYEPGGIMQNYDTIMSEFPNMLARNSDQNPDTNPGTQTWMIVDRMARPWNRPADMPNGPRWDPDPPFYLAAPTPRGPFFYNKYEYAEYDYSHGRCTKQDVQNCRGYLVSLGGGITS